MKNPRQKRENHDEICGRRKAEAAAKRNHAAGAENATTERGQKKPRCHQHNARLPPRATSTTLNRPREPPAQRCRRCHRRRPRPAQRCHENQSQEGRQSGRKETLPREETMPFVPLLAAGCRGGRRLQPARAEGERGNEATDRTERRRLAALPTARSDSAGRGAKASTAKRGREGGAVSFWLLISVTLSGWLGLLSGWNCCC